MNKERSPYGDSIKDFILGEKIGYGGFADVFEAKCKNFGFQDVSVAIKKISKKLVAERRCEDKIRNEIEINYYLSKHYHPAFVKFHTKFEDEEHWYLVLELCANKSLEEYLKRYGPLSEKEAAKLIKEVIVGVQFLHSEHIIHRDLSLRNLLLTEKHEVKIADFGFAIMLNHSDEKTNTVLGTANFMSPEVVNHEPYGYKNDCWSVGCVLYALLYGSPPFNDKKRENIMRSVKKSSLEFPNYASVEAKDLLKSLLNKNQDRRIDMKDALKSAFIRKYEETGDINGYKGQKKGSDSGLSSLSSSRSKNSRSTPSSAEYDNGSNQHRPQKERKSRHVKNAPIARSRDNSHDNTRFNSQDDYRTSQKQKFEHAPYQDSQNSPSFVSQNKNTLPKYFCTLPSRYESQYDTPIKNRPECPSYPADVKYLAERNLNTQIGHSDYVSFSSKNHTIKKSNSSKHFSDYRPNSCVDNYIGGTVEDPSCSHDQYCPDNNCCHKLSCCCRQTRIDACSSSGNLTKEIKTVTHVGNTVEKCLKDIVDPLNTERISCRRKEFEAKDVIISILSDGRVCLEFYKLKKGRKYVHLVYLISKDGLKITIYTPKKKILLNPDQPPPVPVKENGDNTNEVKYFSFENLSKTYWKKYQFAKLFVDKVRSITSKITIYGKKAAFIMMENAPNPNYEMNFYDGCQITEDTKNKTTIKDKNGSVVTNNDVIFSMMNEYKKMKEKCKMLEKNIEAFQDSNFPVVLGKKPDSKKIAIPDYNKENIPPSLNGLNSGVKQCNVTIVTENSGFQNTFQRSVSTPFLSEKSTSSSKNMTNIYSRLKSFKMDENKQWVIAVYKDGVQMHISTQDKSQVFFKNVNAQKPLSPEQYSHLMEQYKKDSDDILLCALLEDVKKKT